MSKIKDVFNVLFTKADNTEKRYIQALEKKEEELLAVSSELQEKQSNFKELEKLYLLNDVSKETFDAEKEKIDALKTRIKEIETEMQLIQVYKTDDLKAVLQELEENQKELSATQQAEIQALKKAVIEAKYNYIKTLVDCRKKYGEIVTPNLKIEQLKDKLGLKNRLYYQSSAYDVLSTYSIKDGGYISAKVEQSEVHDALYLGRIASQLTNEVEN